MTTTHRAPTRRARAFAAVLATAALVLATVAWLGSADAAPVDADSAGTSTCTTNSGGYCTINHGLGRPPEGVLLTPVEPYRGHVSWDQATSASFRLHVQRPFQDRAYVGPVTFSWRVWAAPDLGPSTNPPTSSTQPPTSSTEPPTTPAPTTQPPPTTTAPVPPTTTPPATTTPAPTTTVPAACAYPTCFPSESDTGVPAGTVLAPVSGDLTVSAGQIVDGKNVSGVIRLTGPGVTVRNTQARGLFGCGSCSATVVDSTFDAQTSSGSQSAVVVQAGADLTLTRVEITNAGDLLRLDGGDLTLTDSLLWRTYFRVGDHADAIQFYGPGAGGTVRVVHSSVDVRPYNSTDPGNAAVFLADEPRGLVVEMTRSRWAGGNSSVRLHDALAGTGNVYDFHDNVIVAGSYSGSPGNCGNSVPFNGTAGYKWVGNSLSTGAVLASC